MSATEHILINFKKGKMGSPFVDLKKSPYFQIRLVSEMVSDEITEKSLNHYGIKTNLPLDNVIYSIGSNYKTTVKSIGDDQYNSVFYKEIMHKNIGNPTSGFRLVYSVIKLN